MKKKATELANKYKKDKNEAFATPDLKRIDNPNPAHFLEQERRKILNPENPKVERSMI